MMNLKYIKIGVISSCSCSYLASLRTRTLASSVCVVQVRSDKFKKVVRPV